MKRLVTVALVAALGAGLAAVAPLLAQTPRVAIPGDSIRVGDVVPVALRVTVAPGERVILPPLLPLDGPDLENAARVQERVDTLEDGSLQVTGVYSVTPWRPGTAPLPELSIQVLSAEGVVRSVAAGLPALEVLSILPADPDLLEPMPAKGVLGPSFAWWPFVLLLLALLALAALAYWWHRRRRPAAVLAPAVPRRHPREIALAALHEARQAGLIERSEWKEFYTRVAHAVRVYLEAVEPAWGEDLTTTELLARVRERAGPEHAVALARLLRPADQVKFARHQPDAASAIEEWEAARQWIEDFQWPPRAEPVEVAA
jgi:hypothetical protein